MCLIININLSPKDSLRAAEIAKFATISEGLEVHPQKRRFRKRSSILFLSEHSEGCGCSLLTDNASWNALTWDMIPSALPKLAVTLQRLCEGCSEEFTFNASWVGEKLVEENYLTADAMLEIVRQSRIGTKTKYHIK